MMCGGLLDQRPFQNCLVVFVIILIHGPSLVLFIWAGFTLKHPLAIVDI